MGELYTMSEARPECIDRGVFCCTAMHTILPNVQMLRIH